MKFFIDTANLEQIREATSLGIVDGVTTNPSSIAKESRPLKQIIFDICKITDGPVSVEVIATDAAGMCQEAQQYATWHNNIVIKLPVGTEGLKATKCLSAQGIKTNVTLCFSPSQAILIAKAGATYVSPFV